MHCRKAIKQTQNFRNKKLFQGDDDTTLNNEEDRISDEDNIFRNTDKFTVI
jgi:hypothetical protein